MKTKLKLVSIVFVAFALSIASILALSLMLTLTSKVAKADQVYTLVPQLSVLQSSLKGSDISGSQAGYDIGATIYSHLMPELALETGLLYSKLGAKNDAFLISDEFDIRYLRVPVGIRYNIGGADSNWYARTGLYAAYMTSSERKSQFFGLESSSSISSETNKFDMGLFLGAGYSYDFGNSLKMDIELNYSRGFMKVFKNIDAKNEFVGLTVGMPWNI